MSRRLERLADAAATAIAAGARADSPGARADSPGERAVSYRNAAEALAEALSSPRTRRK